MSDMTVSEVRARLSETVEKVQISGEPVFMTRHGRRVAAVVDSSLLEALLRSAEDLADIQAAEQAHADMAVNDSQPIPWEQVKADLGLT